MSSRKLACVALLGLALTPMAATAATLLSEDFSGAVPGTYGVGVIGGTEFAVTAANVDIVGVLNGSFFACARNPSGNCLDLVGNAGGGRIESSPVFDLTAGTEYKLSFGGVLQGYGPEDPQITTFSVSLGGLSQSLSANGAGAAYSLTFAPLLDASGVHLAFNALTSPDSVHGVVLDHIILTAVPEPASVALLLAGLAGLGALIRRRV